MPLARWAKEIGAQDFCSPFQMRHGSKPSDDASRLGFPAGRWTVVLLLKILALSKFALHQAKR